MPTTDAGDVHRDTLGLIEAVHRGDVEGAQVILDHADTRLVAVFAARVCCDVIEDWLIEDVPDLFGRLRQHYAT